MKYLFLLSLLILSACSSENKPVRFYIKEVTLLASEKTQIDASLALLNDGGNDLIGYSGGDRPLEIRAASLPGTTLSRSSPRTYGCVIEIDTSNGVIQSDPQIIKYIFAHELGHCYGLDYSSDPSDIMYYSLITTWSAPLEDKIKAFGKRLKGSF